MIDTYSEPWPVLYIPALLDGTAAADGNTITNPGGFLHNGAPVSIRQTDATFTAGDASFWSADGATIDDKTRANLDDHYNSRNGYYNLWLKYDANSNVYWACQYPLDYTYTPAAYLRNVRVFGGTPAVPLEVEAGTGIGPNLDWFDNGDGTVILVEDA